MGWYGPYIQIQIVGDKYSLIFAMDSVTAVLEKCKDMAITGVKLGAKLGLRAAAFTAEKSKEIYHSEQVQKGVEKFGEFYQNNKEIVLVTSATAITYGLITLKDRREINRLKKQAEEKHKESEKKHKHGLSLAKTLTEEDNEEEIDSFKDDPSTDFIRKSEAESSFDPKILALEEEESSEDSQEDKIFFEMYQTYQRS